MSAALPSTRAGSRFPTAAVNRAKRMRNRFRAFPLPLQLKQCPTRSKIILILNVTLLLPQGFWLIRCCQVSALPESWAPLPAFVGNKDDFICFWGSGSGRAGLGITTWVGRPAGDGLGRSPGRRPRLPWDAEASPSTCFISPLATQTQRTSSTRCPHRGSVLAPGPIPVVSLFSGSLGQSCGRGQAWESSVNVIAFLPVMRVFQFCFSKHGNRGRKGSRSTLLWDSQGQSTRY